MKSTSSRRPPEQLEDVRKLYSDNLERLGPGPQSVGWRDVPTHRLRFDRLARIFDDARGAVTVGDLGCGYGALLTFLDERGIEVRRYVGYDISGEMLAAAREALPDPRVDFVLGGVIDRDVDYVVASGTFNVKFDASNTDWREYTERTLEAAWARAGRGLAFNMLTSYVDWREPHLFYADPHAFLDFCRTRLSPRVALLHDYPLYEWTMLVRRESG